MRGRSLLPLAVLLATSSTAWAEEDAAVEHLRLTDVSRTSAALTWSGGGHDAELHLVPAREGRTLVAPSSPAEDMVAPLPGAEARAVPGAGGSARVEGLAPGTRYLAWVATAAGRSERIAFHTAPPAGATQFVRLRLVAVLFANASRVTDAERPGAREPLAPEEVARIERELQRCVDFYWVCSGMRVLLDVDLVVDDRFVTTPAENKYGLGFKPEADRAFRAACERAGKDWGGDYDGRLYITAEKVWDARAGRFRLPSSGGGTIGPRNRVGNAKSAWRAGGDNAWLFCHEFGHALDALYRHSGAPEYLFNHPRPWDGTAGRSGRHWDVNAWLLQWWGGYVTHDDPDRQLRAPDLWFRYFQLRFGRVLRSADADEDGVPDADPRVPLDEARLGTSLAARDTDGDGLGDLEEVMVTQGFGREGHGEVWARGPWPRACDPTRPDTDGDGLRDGDDRYPLYPVDPRLRRGAPAHTIARLDDPAVGAARVTAAWRADGLVLEVTADRQPRRVVLTLDADDDGWFRGRDNLGLTLTCGRRGDLRVALHDCSQRERGPFTDRRAFEEGGVLVRERWRDDGLYQATIVLPPRPDLGLALEPGERIGVAVGLEPRGGGDLVTAYEPHRLVALELAAEE